MVFIGIRHVVLSANENNNNKLNRIELIKTKAAI